MAIDSSLTNNIEQSYDLHSSNGNAGDIGSLREFINTSDSFDAWRKFTNRIAQDLETLMDQVDSINALGAPASSPTFTGAPVLNQFSLDSNVFSSVRTHSELIRSTANASDNSIVTEKAISAMRDTLNTAIATKATLSNPSFTGNSLFENGILTLRDSTSDTELRINAQGNNKAILKFGGPDTVTDTGIDVDASVEFDFTDGITPATTGLAFRGQVPVDSGTFSLHNQYGFETTISNGNSATFSINVTAITGTVGFYINILSTGGVYEDTILPAEIGNGDGVISSTGSYSFSTNAFTDGDRKLQFLLAVASGESVTVDSFEAELTGDSGQTDARIEVDTSGNITFHSTSLNLTSAGTVTGISQTEVGLGNVTNESKATMFTSPTFTGTARYTGSIGAADDSTKIATTAWTQDLVAEKITAEFDTNNANARLDNIDNTSDADKPISTLTQAALDLKAPKASPTFTGNVTAATAPTATSHLTNKSYVDTQVATKDNYDHFTIRAETGTTVDIESGDTINFSVFSAESDAINFTRDGKRIGLTLSLASLDATKDGIIPNTSLPTGVNGIDTTYIQPSAYQAGPVTVDGQGAISGFTDNTTSLMSAAAIDDLINIRVNAGITGQVSGTFVNSVSTSTKGLDVAVNSGALTVNLDMDELDINEDSNTDDYFIIGHRTTGTDTDHAPERIRYGDVDITHLDYDNKITLAELSGVADSLTATDNNALMYDSSSSSWKSQSLNNVISLDNISNVNLTTPGNKALLWYNSSSQEWIDVTIDTVIDKDNHSADLNDIANNVSDTTPSNGQVLKWNGSAWAPAADNNTTYSATSDGGLQFSGTSLRLKNYSSLSDNQLMRWDDTNSQLENSGIAVGTSQVDIGNRNLVLRNLTGSDQVLIDAYVDAGSAGTLPVAKGAYFTGTNTRKAGIKFGRADNELTGASALSNDPGYIIHESGASTGDRNRSVIHICPGDDNADNTDGDPTPENLDYVTIKGINKADSTGLILGTNGLIEGVRELKFKNNGHGTLASSINDGDGSLRLQRINSSAGTARRGGRIILQKGRSDDGYFEESWGIQSSSAPNENRDDFVIFQYSSGTASSALAINETTGVVSAPSATPAEITADHDLVTLEKLESYTDSRIAFKLYGPKPKFKFIFHAESNITNGDKGTYYRGNDAQLKIEFFQMANCGFQKHTDGYYYVSIFADANGGDDIYRNAGRGYFRFNTESFGPSVFANIGDIAPGAHPAGISGAYNVRYFVAIHDMVSGRQYQHYLPAISVPSGANQEGSLVVDARDALDTTNGDGFAGASSATAVAHYDPQNY